VGVSGGQRQVDRPRASNRHWSDDFTFGHSSEKLRFKRKQFELTFEELEGETELADIDIDQGRWMSSMAAIRSGEPDRLSDAVSL